MLSGIFGSGPSAPNFGVAQGYMQNLSGLASNYGQLGSSAANNYSVYNANNMAALKNYANYLNQNPGTNAQDAAYIAQAEQGAQGAAQRAQNNLSQSLAERGISNNSSAAIGGLASIQQGLAANDAGVRANLANDLMQQHNANQAALASLWGGAAGNAFGQTESAYGGQGSIYSNLASLANQQALANYQAQLQKQQGNNAFLGALGGVVSALPSPMTGGYGQALGALI